MKYSRVRSVLVAWGFVVAVWAPVDAQRSDTSSTVVVMETSRGEITIRMLPSQAPNSVANFLSLVEQGFYDEMLFHRVVKDFVIQAGLIDMEGRARQHNVEPLRNEATPRHRNTRGTVAMARTDNPHSATTEFFINVRDNRALDFRSFARSEIGYTVFAEVVEGMDVVNEIADIPTRRIGPFRNFPEDPVAIYRVYILPPDVN
ncbi:MAG: peptidylprolyl isomerase [Gemmatimonadota bacterium]|nr:peptidylprolyl isomerase [Gemmatimonadota bacterium]MDH5803854.1 peptidylprolyl isomerase [Gemmatimonadota bacterium]